MSKPLSDKELEEQVKSLMRSFADDAIAAAKTRRGFAFKNQIPDMLKIIHSQKLAHGDMVIGKDFIPEGKIEEAINGTLFKNINKVLAEQRERNK